MKLSRGLAAGFRAVIRSASIFAFATLLQILSTTAAAQPTESESAVEYLHVDALGSVRVVTDAQGAVISRHDYLPFGEEVPVASRTGLAGYSATLVPAAPQRFTGKERDNETGLDYFGARYYASSMGRFASPDAPLADQEVGDPQSWNLYTYAGNSPYVFVDEDGNIKLLVTVVKAVVKGGDIYSSVSGVAEAAGKVFSADPSVGTKDRLMATASLVGEISGASDLLKGGKAIAKSMDAVKVADNVGDGAKALNAAGEATKATNKLPTLPRGPGAVPKQERDPKRVWSKAENNRRLDAQGGLCENCEEVVPPGKGRGHHKKTRHADGGRTVPEEHAVVCVDCHKKLHP